MNLLEKYHSLTEIIGTWNISFGKLSGTKKFRQSEAIKNYIAKPHNRKRLVSIQILPLVKI